MKSSLVAAALAGTTLEEHPGIFGRQNTDREEVSRECRDSATSFYSAFPAEPPSLPKFSSSYYETAPRTARNPDGECAWVTEVPKSLYTEVIEYNLEVLDWFRRDENVGLLESVVNECHGTEGTATPCHDEWDELKTNIVDETGFDPQKLETGDDEDEGVDEAASEDSESSAGPLQTVTLTALLATLWCVVVLV